MFAILFPVYPVFGAVLYNISGGIRNSPIDTSSIIDEEYYDKANAEFISADIPLDAAHDWSGRLEVISYTVQEGDTIGQLARDFGISRDTIRWVNTLSSNTVRVGQTLIIPPGNGYVYVSKEGDTLDSIARKYTTTTDEIIKNNSHISSLPWVGSMVYLPGMKPPVVTPVSVARQDAEESVENTLTYKLRLLNPKWKWFVPGHCTYFVAKYWNVNWRWNAKDWYKNAQKAGYKTGQTAKVGSIVVWYGPGYNLAYGHVAIVMSINAKNGTMIVKDMNYTGLWRITTRTEKLKNRYIVGFIYDEKK